MSLSVLAAASIIVSSLPATFRGNQGFSSVVRTSVGVVELTLDGGGVDASACSIDITSHVTLSASQLCSFGVTHTSDTVKTITTLREDAAGAASTLWDVNFDITVFRKSP